MCSREITNAYPTPTRTAPLTSLQRYWIKAAREEKLDDPVVCTIGIRLEGRVDPNCLARALYALVQRHEPLRTRIVNLGGKAMQVVDPNSYCQFAYRNLTTGDTYLGIDVARHEFVKWCTRALNTSLQHSFGAMLIDVDERTQILFLFLHHLFADPFSMEILRDDLLGVLRGSPLASSSQCKQFADFSIWEEQTRRPEFDEHVRYFHRLLSTVEFPQLRAPTVSTDTHANAVDVVRFTIDESTFSLLRRCARANGTTLPICLLTAFGLALGQWSGLESLVICDPLTLRRTVDLERTVGFLSTYCPLLVPGRATSLAEALEQVTDSVLIAHEHAEFPVEKLLDPETLGFDEITFNYIPSESRLRQACRDGTRVTETVPHNTPTNRHIHHLMCVLTESDDGSIRGELMYNQNVLSLSEALEVVRYLQQSTEWIASG